MMHLALRYRRQIPLVNHRMRSGKDASCNAQLVCNRSSWLASVTDATSATGRSHCGGWPTAKSSSTVHIGHRWLSVERHSRRSHWQLTACVCPVASIMHWLWWHWSEKQHWANIGSLLLRSQSTWHTDARPVYYVAALAASTSPAELLRMVFTNLLCLHV